MARGLIILIFVMLAAAGYLIVTQYQNTYKLLPGVEHPVQVDPYSLWRPYKSETGTFEALFPTLPQRATDTLKDPHSGEERKYDMYVSETNTGSIFMVSLITYSGKEKLDTKAVLENVRDEMVAAHPNNKLSSSTEKPFQGYPSVDFAIENPEAHIDGLSFFVGNTLYLLSYVSKKEHYDHSQYDYFLNSFKLLKKDQGTATSVKPVTK